MTGVNHMPKTLSAAAAKARFADCVREAEHGAPVLITRHGKAVAALVAAGDLKEIQRLRAAGPGAGLAGLLGGWKGSEEMVSILSRSRRSRARRLPGLDE
jgi:prevent-host-death family protein